MDNGSRQTLRILINLEFKKYKTRLLTFVTGKFDFRFGPGGNRKDLKFLFDLNI